MYTCGLLDVLLDEKIKVDCIMGVSAGALFGVNFKSRQRGRGIRFNLKYIKDKRYMGLYPLITTGNIVNQEFCFNDIPNILDDFNYASFKRTKEDFYAVVTNMYTGKAEYKKIDELKGENVEYLRASGSMPFVSKPVEVNGQKYLDGGIADSIPIDKMVKMGYDKIIVVLTRPVGYRKRRANTSLAKVVYKDYPKLIDAMAKRYRVYNKSVDEVELLSKTRDVFLIRPSKHIKIKRIEKNEKVLKEMYELGVNDTKEKLTELKEYLK